MRHKKRRGKINSPKASTEKRAHTRSKRGEVFTAVIHVTQGRVQEIGSTGCGVIKSEMKPNPVSEAKTSRAKIEATQAVRNLRTACRFYSMYGHIAKLAEEIKKGASSVEGVEVKLWQVPETLNEEVLGKMGAPPKTDAPTITPQELAEADGVLFGFPTRFGMMAAQMKAFFDATGGLWREQSLAGKPAGIFFSTGTQGGGQETTALTAVTQLTHHGMVFVPVGYTFGAKMFGMEKVQGGSPYGAGTFAGDGSRWPTEVELEHAFHQGKYFAGIAKKLKGSSSSA